MEHLERQHRCHRDAGREPGEDGLERQSRRALPRHLHQQQDLRKLRRCGERDGQQLRQPCLLHTREPCLQRPRQQPRHLVEHRDVRLEPLGPVVAGAVLRPGHDEPHHAGPAAAGRPHALDLESHPDLRRQEPRDLRPGQVLLRARGPAGDLPHDRVPHPARHRRRDDQRHAATARRHRGRLRRGGDPRRRTSKRSFRCRAI